MSHTKVSLGMIGHSGELTSFNYHLPEIDDVGLAWALNFAPGGRADVIQAVIAPMTLMNFTRTNASVTVAEDVASIPADPHAQRELALRVSYVDTVTFKKYRFDIPGPAPAVIPSGTDDVPLDNVLFALFITAAELDIVSVDDNPIEITAGRIVGRNN